MGVEELQKAWESTASCAGDGPDRWKRLGPQPGASFVASADMSTALASIRPSRKRLPARNIAIDGRHLVGRGRGEAPGHMHRGAHSRIMLLHDGRPPTSPQSSSCCLQTASHHNMSRIKCRHRFTLRRYSDFRSVHIIGASRFCIPKPSCSPARGRRLMLSKMIDTARRRSQREYSVFHFSSHHTPTPIDTHSSHFQEPTSRSFLALAPNGLCHRLAIRHLQHDASGMGE